MHILLVAVENGATALKNLAVSYKVNHALNPVNQLFISRYCLSKTNGNMSAKNLCTNVYSSQKLEIAQMSINRQINKQVEDIHKMEYHLTIRMNC